MSIEDAIIRDETRQILGGVPVHPQDKLLCDPSSCGLSELVSLIDNYVGETRARAWADKQPTLSHLIDGLRLEWVVFCRTLPAARVETQFGRYMVCGHGYWMPDSRELPCNSIDDGKAKCLADYKQRVRAIFEGV